MSIAPDIDVDRDAIDQSEVDDIDRDLGVVALAQDFVDFAFGEHRLRRIHLGASQ